MIFKDFINRTFGSTGALTGADIPYDGTDSLNDKIDQVETDLGNIDLGAGMTLLGSVNQGSIESFDGEQTVRIPWSILEAPTVNRFRVVISVDTLDHADAWGIGFCTAGSTSTYQDDSSNNETVWVPNSGTETTRTQCVVDLHRFYRIGSFYKIVPMAISSDASTGWSDTGYTRDSSVSTFGAKVAQSRGFSYDNVRDDTGYDLLLSTNAPSNEVNVLGMVVYGSSI